MKPPESDAVGEVTKPIGTLEEKWRLLPEFLHVRRAGQGGVSRGAAAHALVAAAAGAGPGSPAHCVLQLLCER